MATKPTVRVPIWASGGTTTDPGAGKESAGWLVSERPPANWLNFVWNSFGQWMDYFANDTKPVVAAGLVLVSDTFSWSENCVGTPTANGAGDTPPRTIIIEIADDFTGDNVLPFVQFAAASAASEFYFPRATLTGGKYLHVQFANAFGVGTPVDPTVEDLSFYFAIIGHITP